jgi:hypothetical protein
VKALFACPRCEFPAQASLAAPLEWQCAQCEAKLSLPCADPALPVCLVCGNHELYKKKDFPHWLGLNLLVLAFIASAVTYLLYLKWLTWAILIGTAVFDGALFLWVGDAIVCYRCNAHYKGFQATPAHQPYELTTGERYRQERLRREQMPSNP